jgi:hypothetical protein
VSELWSLAENLGRERDFRITRKSFAEEIALAIGLILKEDGRSRDVFAEDLTAFLGEKVSRAMLDAYASKARKEHSVPAQRLFAIVAISGRWDILDALISKFDVRIATFKDVALMETGKAYLNLRRLERKLDAE